MKLLIIGNGRAPRLAVLASALSEGTHQVALVPAETLSQALRGVENHSDSRAIIVLTDALEGRPLDFIQTVRGLHSEIPLIVIKNDDGGFSLSIQTDALAVLLKAGATRVLNDTPRLQDCLLTTVVASIRPNGVEHSVVTKSTGKKVLADYISADAMASLIEECLREFLPMVEEKFRARLNSVLSSPPETSCQVEKREKEERAMVVRIQEVQLKSREKRMLGLILKKPGSLVAKTTLISEFNSNEMVMEVMSRLRREVRIQAPEALKYIHTYTGEGYAFHAPR